MYGNGLSVNEFGHPKTPKDIRFVHAAPAPRCQLNMDDVRDLVRTFRKAHGKNPTKLFVNIPSCTDTWIGFTVDDVFVTLDIDCNAAEDSVA
jgi:hypothetical protein